MKTSHNFAPAITCLFAAKLSFPISRPSLAQTKSAFSSIAVSRKGTTHQVPPSLQLAVYPLDNIPLEIANREAKHCYQIQLESMLNGAFQNTRVKAFPKRFNLTLLSLL